MSQINRTSYCHHNEHILKQRVSENEILLNVTTGHYYALDEVGARVWELCDGDRRVAEIATIIGSEYEAPLETIERDILELLQELADEKLVIERH